MVGMSKHHYIHTVSFPFSGDEEILSYRPENYTYSTSDRGMVSPHGNEINVEVDLPQLNPDQAIAQARGELSMTIRFIDSNNATVREWNRGVEQRIDQQLQSKCEELIRLFGGK